MGFKQSKDLGCYEKVRKKMGFGQTKDLTNGNFHDQGLGGSEKMTFLKSHFFHDIFTQMAPLGPWKTISTLSLMAP